MEINKLPGCLICGTNQGFWDFLTLSWTYIILLREKRISWANVWNSHFPSRPPKKRKNLINIKPICKRLYIWARNTDTHTVGTGRISISTEMKAISIGLWYWQLDCFFKCPQHSFLEEYICGWCTTSILKQSTPSRGCKYILAVKNNASSNRKCVGSWDPHRDKI